METDFKTPFGTFLLQRLPYRKRELLRAWDAADEHILNHIADNTLLENKPRILIINDNFGALSIALHEASPCAMSDSWLSQQGTKNNLKNNQISQEHIHFLNSLKKPEG